VLEIVNNPRRNMNIPIKPMADYIVAVAEEVSNKTTSGFYLPEKATEKPKFASVVAIGANTKEIKIGDKVIYKSYSTTEVKVEGKEYILVKEEDILAKVGGEK
jgi:chaperonin GroES